MLFRTDRTSFGVIGAELLGQYMRNIKEAAEIYPGARALIYQFDTRTRHDHAQEVRYQLTMEDEVAQKNGWQRRFDKTRPWHFVWKRPVNGEDSWWKKAVGKAVSQHLPWPGSDG